MDERQFRRRLRELGHEEPRMIELPADADGVRHRHEFPSLGLVLRGQARIQLEGHRQVDEPGDGTEVPAGVALFGKAGAEGATVLLAFKSDRGPDA
jgi:quercetin dioxygenase-like cupin family protein